MSKILYEKPTTELLEVRFGGDILIISGGGNIDNATEEDYGEL